MIAQRTWSTLAGKQLFTIRAGERLTEQRTDTFAALFERALNEVERSGIAAPQIVRSRIWARDAGLRRLASDARLLALNGARRAASASLIAPERLADGADVIIDLIAMSGEGKKLVREYAPRIAPPMFVALDGLVFLSGNTDVSATFADQLNRICLNIATALASAGTQLEKITHVDAYIATRLDWTQARHAIGARFPVPVEITTVEGFSAPEKLIEIEVTAQR